MATLLVSNARGRKRTCNAKCYKARERECDCICGGSNHGIGERRARERARETGISWSQRAKGAPAVGRRKIRPTYEQGELFSLS
jgi:hypothetical protein